MQKETQKLELLFLSWRDIKSPNKGGAEVFTHEMLKRLDQSKYHITHFSPLFSEAKQLEIIDGIKYIRKGNIITVILHAMVYYKKNRKNIDFVVDQCNTHQFFTPLWVEKKKRIFFIHQLTREIWYYNAGFPINYIGYLLEPAFLKLHQDDYTITVSKSTFEDLVSLKFNSEKVRILPEGLDFTPWHVGEFCKKEENLTFIYVGRMVDYKGIDDSVKAFVKVKKIYPEAMLWIVGNKNENYLEREVYPLLKESCLNYGNNETFVDVVFWGFVSEEKKLELMSKAHALLFPSLREGWGLIVTEAAAVGTPSITYPSPGIRDAVDYGRAGYMCMENNIDQLADLMKCIPNNHLEYEDMRMKAYYFSRQFHWDKTANCFVEFLMRLEQNNNPIIENNPT